MIRFQNYKFFGQERSGGTKKITNIVGYLYSFRALFVLYLVELDNGAGLIGVVLFFSSSFFLVIRKTKRKRKKKRKELG